MLMIRESRNLLDQDHFGDMTIKSHSNPHIIQGNFLKVSRNFDLTDQGWPRQIIGINCFTGDYFCANNLRDQLIPSGGIDD